MTCIYKTFYAIIWPAIQNNVSVKLVIRIPTPCSDLLVTTNRKIRGSVDISFRVNQHNLRTLIRLTTFIQCVEYNEDRLSNTRICLRPKGCNQQFGKHDIHWMETPSKITPNCILHTLCYNGSRFRKIVCNCLDDNVHPTYSSSPSQTPTWFPFSNLSLIVLAMVLFPSRHLL